MPTWMKNIINIHPRQAQAYRPRMIITAFHTTSATYCPHPINLNFQAQARIRPAQGAQPMRSQCIANAKAPTLTAAWHLNECSMAQHTLTHCPALEACLNTTATPTLSCCRSASCAKRRHTPGPTHTLIHKLPEQTRHRNGC